MKIELNTISTKKQLLLITLTLPLTPISLVLLPNDFYINWICSFICFLLAVYLMHVLSRVKTSLEFNSPDYFLINSDKIFYDNIIGYVINNKGKGFHDGLILKRKKGKLILITSISFVKDGQKIITAKKKIINQLKSNNPKIIELRSIWD